MYSDDGEYVPFAEILILTGPSEKWLSLIERAMHAALTEKLRMTRKSLRKMLTKRDKWLNMWPGQLCLTSCLIQWTTDCTKSLVLCKIFEIKKPLKKLRRKQNNVLSRLSEMSRKNLSKQLRLKVNSLITIEIHGRDVIDRMYRMSRFSLVLLEKSCFPQAQRDTFARVICNYAKVEFLSNFQDVSGKQRKKNPTNW